MTSGDSDGATLIPGHKTRNYKFFQLSSALRDFFVEVAKKAATLIAVSNCILFGGGGLFVDSGGNLTD